MPASGPAIDHPVDYPVPNFGQDSDIKISLENTKNAEEKLKVTWNPPALVQAEEEVNVDSDPICSSAGCTQYKQPEGEPSHPMDYFVPDFGVDHDIKDSFTGLKTAE